MGGGELLNLAGRVRVQFAFVVFMLAERYDAAAIMMGCFLGNDNMAKAPQRVESGLDLIGSVIKN